MEQTRATVAVKAFRIDTAHVGATPPSTSFSGEVILAAKVNRGMGANPVVLLALEYRHSFAHTHDIHGEILKAHDALRALVGDIAKASLDQTKLASISVLSEKTE